MQRNLNFKFMLGILLLVGCNKQDASSQSDMRQKPVESAGVASSFEKQEIATAFTEDSEAVLASIYKQKVEATNGGRLTDGRYVSFWRGQEFQLNGKNYFTAFSEATSPSENEYPAPKDQVTIAQATYQYNGGEWQLKTVQDIVGKFGAFEKAPSTDRSRKSKIFPGESGKLFLSIPTFQTATAGMRLLTEDLFVFQESNLQWQYLGQLSVGSDNTEGCAHKPASTTSIQCAKSIGSLNLIDWENDKWPIFEVRMQATVIDTHSKVISSTPKAVVSYYYDEQSSGYVKAIP